MNFESKISVNFIKPVPLPVIAANIPEELRALPRWVLWKYEQVSPSAKWSKVPKTTKGYAAQSNNPSTWTTFEEAHAAYQTGAFDGLGLVLGVGIDGVDVDDSYDPETGDFSELAQLALKTVQGYAEVSPSSTGIKIFAMTNLATSYKRKEIELYSSNSGARYFCVTGHVIPTHRSISEDIQDVSELVNLFDKKRVDLTVHTDAFANLKSSYEGWSLNRIQSEILPLLKGDDYFEWLNVGMALHYETNGSDDGLEVWDAWSEKSDRYEPEACERKWRTFGLNDGGPKITMGTYIAKLKESGFNLSLNLKGPLRVLSIPELLSQPPQAWLVKGVIPKSGTGVIYGDSGAGKTFITIDMALSVARRIPWQGRRVKEPVGVLYVSAEGSSAMSARIQAYAKYHNLALDGLPFGIVPTAVNLRSEDTTRVIDASRSMAERGHPVGLIVFDTLNRTMGGGDENSSKDMGEYLDAISRISDQTGAFALVVHHSGKNKQMGARGHSSLRAAVDVELEVKADGEQQVLTITKSRDGATGTEFVYRREVVCIGVDEDMDAIDSCVAIPGDPSSLSSKKPKVQGKWQGMAYRALTTLGDGVSHDAVVEEIGALCGHVERWKEPARRGIKGCIDVGVFISRGGLLFMA